MRNSARGFTLIEMLVVLCLLAVISTFGLVMSWNTYQSYSFLAQRNLLVELLQKARGQAVTNIDQSAHGLYMNQSSGELVLFEGRTFAARDSSKDVIFSGGGFSLSGVGEVVFLQLSGTSNVAGTIILKDGKFRQTEVTLNTEGQIDY